MVALQAIQEFIENQHNSPYVKTVYYEKLVIEPQKTVKDLYDWMGIPFSDDILNISNNHKTKGIFGDDVYDVNRSITYGHKLVQNSEDRWKRLKSTSILAQFVQGYLYHLGYEFLDRYGYEKSEVDIYPLKSKIFKSYLHYEKNKEIVQYSFMDFLKAKLFQALSK